ncbi:Dyp-type peroxidase [Gynuella sp.]|uniref:Dyp-type peroxidase n=1 Tax=Gynuella sp. TaxID=2969146 RepID=UPI003D0C5067
MMTTPFQPGILEEIPAAGCFLFADLLDVQQWDKLRSALEQLIDGHGIVLGVGSKLLKALGKAPEGMQEFPDFQHPAAKRRDYDLWFWLRAEDPGALHHLLRMLLNATEEFITVKVQYQAFRYQDGRDLSGYLDGTENPTGADAEAAAFVTSSDQTQNGASLVTVQPWVHELDYFKSLPQNEQDDTFGRRLADNEEFEDSPASAHVKRTAQESFDPESFMLRRSMPWTDHCNEAGLVFVSFVDDFAKFNRMFERMLGLDDGIEDGLFSFSMPLFGINFWCPPVTENGRINLQFLRD